MSAFGGKADMSIGTCPLFRSLLGVKRTCVAALHESAFDPKRTSAPFLSTRKSCYDPVVRASRGQEHEAAGIHSLYCLQRGADVAVLCSRTANGEAGDRVHERPLPRRFWTSLTSVSKRSGRIRL